MISSACAVLMMRVTFVATIKMCDYNKLDNIVEKNHSHTEPWSTFKKKLQELEYKTSTCLLMWSGCVLLSPVFALCAGMGQI